MTVWKYAVSLGPQNLLMPDGARLVAAGMQDGRICVWALVEPARPHVETPVWVCGTGQHVPVEMAFVATVFDGLNVWHVFGPASGG